MAAHVRLLLLLSLQALVHAQPVLIDSHPQLLLPRNGPTISNVSGTVEVFDPNTHQSIPQAPATDGGGSGFDLPALIWIGFSLVIGIPMACAGIRGWRLTTGAGIGVTLTVCAWAAINNTVSAPGLSDILVTLLSLALFVVGFAIGVFEFARLVAIALLAITGGVAFGTRIILIKDGLLLSNDNLYAVNLAIIGVLGVAFGLTIIWSQRAGILLGCASIGTFLIGLGIDLIISKQAGLSRGLRFLFDRNDSHLADLITNGYSPTLLTKIIIIASLALTPVLAYAQHKIFKQPFNRRPKDSDSELNIDFPVDEANRKRSIFFPIFDSPNKLKTSPSRFSM